jgi:hypothetical protein
MDKRTFLKNAGLAGLGGMLSMESLAKMFESVSAVPSAELARRRGFLGCHPQRVQT